MRMLLIATTVAAAAIAPLSAASARAPHPGQGMALAQPMDHMQGAEVSHASPTGKSGMVSLSKLSGKAFTIAFLSQMLAHHQMAIQMGNDALPTLKVSRVRIMTRKIIRDQKREVTRMTSWLRRWYGVTPSVAQMALMKADNRHMVAMRTGGDHAFLNMMTPHHQQAVAMARTAIRKTERSEVRALARNIIRSQSKEVNEFQRIKRAHGWR